MLIYTNGDIYGSRDAPLLASLNLRTQQVEFQRWVNYAGFSRIVAHAVMAFSEQGYPVNAGSDERFRELVSVEVYADVRYFGGCVKIEVYLAKPIGNQLCGG
jgi:hypothetical protein